jgi:hypothetical protein
MLSIMVLNRFNDPGPLAVVNQPIRIMMNTLLPR